MAEITQPVSSRTRPPGLCPTGCFGARDHLRACETVEKTLAPDGDEAPPPPRLSVFWFQIEIDNFNAVPWSPFRHTHTRSHTCSHSSGSEKKEGEMSTFVGRMRLHTQSNGIPLRGTGRGARACQRRSVTRLVLHIRFCNGMAFSEPQGYL